MASASGDGASFVQMVAQAATAGSGRRAAAVQGTGRDGGAGEAQGRLRRRFEMNENEKKGVGGLFINLFGS